MQAFAYFGSESPFMVEEFQSYFLGGVDDMATWTSNVWREVIYMLDKGTRYRTDSYIYNNK